MAIKRYSAFPKAPTLLEPHHEIVSSHTQETRGGVSYPSAKMPSVYSTALNGWPTGYSLGESYSSTEIQSVYS